jgi:peptidoglycan/LPS O-acetylase OafA/YrhL
LASISVNYPRAWYGSRWFVGALGVVILFVVYASLWRITDHHLEWRADSYFARTFRFNLVSLGFAMLLPVASSWQLVRETFASTAVRRIALWSYALYLVHFPFFQVVAKYTPARWTSSFVQSMAVTSLQFAAVSFPWRQGRPLYNAVLFRDAKTFHPSRSSRCLLVRNSSTDGTIKLAVQVCRDQLRRPAAGTQTES